MNFKPLFFSILFLLLSNLYAQDTIPNNDFDKISEKADQLSTDEKYHEAYLEYDKINKNDSNRVHSLISKSYYLLNDEQLDSTRYDLVVEMMDEGINHSDVLSKLNYFINKSVTLSKQKKYKEALKTYDEALLIYPKNSNLYYRKALIYESLNQFDEAVKMYKKSILLNPFKPDAHLKLGNLCYKSNKITEALICINFYLLLNPDGENALNVLSAINTIVSSNADVEEPIDVEISNDDESFEELDLILNNHISLDKKYKIRNKIKVALVKQNHLLLEQLKDYEGNNGFFHKRYVPFYNWLRENDHFNNFTYTICYSSTSDEYTKFIQSKTEDIKSFLGLAFQQIEKDFSENNIEFNGKKQPVNFYYEKNKLVGIGIKEGDKMTGYWELYSNDGFLRSKGNYDESEKKTGKWIWFYEDGNIKEEAHYKEGKLEGSFLYYFNSGKLNYSGNYADGKLNGGYQLYNKKGALIEQKQFVDGELDGDYKSFYEIGEAYPEYVIPYKSGKINGKLIQYHINGKVAFECNYIDGKKEGLGKDFYKNGQLTSEMNYKEGNIFGESKKYYPDGKVKEIGQLENSEYVGSWKSFHNNGNLYYESNYSKNKLHGIYKEYDNDGKHFLTYEYRKGDIYSYSFFDKEGTLIHSDDKKSGTLNYKSYHPNGNKRSEGLYDLKGGKEGQWKFYSNNGVLNSVSSYQENLSNEKSVFYFNDGKEEVIRYYKNGVDTGYYFKQNRLEEVVKQGWQKEGEMHGIWKTYYSNNVLKTKNHYNNGKSEGDHIAYDVEGGIASIYHYKNDILEFEKHYNDRKVYDSLVIPSNEKDTLYTHYTNGKVSSQLSYTYGRKNGKYVNYYPNGNVKISGQYLNSEKNGEWIWYHENGHLDSKYTYIYGDVNGDIIEYYENDEIKEKTSYILGNKNGKKEDYNDKGVLTGINNYDYGLQQGKKYFYSEDGHIQLIRFYNNNQLTGYSYLDKGGKELPIIPIKNETVKLVSYFDNGKKSREMELVNGDFEGAYITYYYSGQIRRERSYIHNLEEGPDKIYYPTGKLKKISHYIADSYNGKVIEYYENGKVKKETVYLLGKKHGKSIHYSDNGTIVSQKSYYDGNLIFN
jgi:antitoxin component YwqK of YwqJK toxin-antitoxin module